MALRPQDCPCLGLRPAAALPQPVPRHTPGGAATGRHRRTVPVRAPEGLLPGVSPLWLTAQRRDGAAKGER